MKEKRHEKIIELINQYDIETQDELAEHLRNAGFQVTQATVSRDIRKLKLSKVPAGADSKYTDILTSQEADFFCCIGNSVFSAIIIKEWQRAF